MRQGMHETDETSTNLHLKVRSQPLSDTWIAPTSGATSPVSSTTFLPSFCSRRTFQSEILSLTRAFSGAMYTIFPSGWSRNTDSIAISATIVLPDPEECHEWTLGFTKRTTSLNFKEITYLASGSKLSSSYYLSASTRRTVANAGQVLPDLTTETIYSSQNVSYSKASIVS